MRVHISNTDGSAAGALYRDRENAWIFGVCAGVADRFNLHVAVLRVAVVLSLLLFFWVTAGIYLAAAVLIREKPLTYAGPYTEYEFWRPGHRDYRREP